MELNLLVNNSNKMDEQIKKNYLYPAALFAEKERFFVDTILGSCVAICLFDKLKSIGGINHFMLPLWNGNGLASPKYGNIATEKLIEKMLKNGAERENIVAKIFGGSNQMESSMNIGQRNIDIAKEVLNQNNIKIIAENTGGNVGRKLRFDTGTGQVMMKFLNKSEKK